MYEHDYDECANEEQFTEETLQDGLRQLITDGYDSSEICWENLRVQTYSEAGLYDPRLRAGHHPARRGASSN